MIRTQIYLPDDLHQELTFLSQKTGENISTLIREGAWEVIKKKKKTKKNPSSFFGALKKGPKDLSTKINDIYLLKF